MVIYQGFWRIFEGFLGLLSNLTPDLKSVTFITYISMYIWLIQGLNYLLGQRFCVLCSEICTPSFSSPSPLCGASSKTKQALNL